MEKISLAEVLKPQGIKGEIKFRLLAESLEIIKNAKQLFLGDEKVTLLDARETNGFVYIKFNEITSVVVAERFRGQKLMVDRTELEDGLDDGEYFIADLIGKQVVFENGEILGELTDVQNFGSADVFYVNKTSGKELLFSNIEGVIIKVENNRIVLNREKFEQVSVE